MEDKVTDKVVEDKVIVDGLSFVPYIRSCEIQQRVKEIAADLRKDLKGKNLSSSACSTELLSLPPIFSARLPSTMPPSRL